ncbi:MAG: VCBS repeat-containing protein [Candidatus Limnocylindrales bacterium]
MSCFPAPPRTLITALGLSLLLLADGLVAAPGPVMGADEVADGAGVSASGDAVVCASGFDQVDSRVGISLHGVTLLDEGAMAVGYARQRDDDDFGRRTPATLLNDGSQWSRVFTGSPGQEDGLMAVATSEDAGTWAVGWTTVNGRVMPLAMRWNGLRWKTDRPVMRGSLPAVFTDVTIVGDGSPFAVGYRVTATGRRQPLVIRRDGPRWRNIAINTGKRESVTLTGVSADRRGGTWVVGHGGPGAETRPVIYRRQDGAWQRIKAPRLPGEAVLTDVVAVTAQDGWAVGYHRLDGRSEPLVLRWNGKHWRQAEPPVFASTDVLLTAVAADPDGGVWVVGAAWDHERRSHQAIAAWWDGRAWNEFAGHAGGTELHDVIGSLDGDGWAVGRSGQSARATRVCTPAQAGVFGGTLPGSETEPLPTPGLTASSAEEAVSVEATAIGTTAAVGTTAAAAPGIALPVVTGGAAAGAGGYAGAVTDDEQAVSIESGSIDEAPAMARAPERKKKAKPKARRPRAAAVKTGSLPTARVDRAVVARDVALRAGIYEETGTYGAVVADFDGDGVDDLFIGRHGRKGRLLLNRDGVFVDHAPLELPSIDRHGCTAADIDGSGLLDLYCVVGGKRGSGLKSNELWLDPGGPNPVEVAVERGLSDPTGRGRLAAFLQAKKQADIKLVVANSPTRVDGLPSLGRLFRSRGDGQFDAVARTGFEPRLGALAMQAADIDGDGREDLLLLIGGPQAPKQDGTRLYRNTPRGLVDVTRRMGVRSINEVDAVLVDLDKDGKLDLVQLSPTTLRVSILKKGKYVISRVNMR